MPTDSPKGLRFTMNCTDGSVTVEGEGFSLLGSDAPDIILAVALAHYRYWESTEEESPLPLGDEVYVDLVRRGGKYTAEFSGEDGYFPSTGMALAALVEFCSMLEDLLLEAAGDDSGEVPGPLDMARGWQPPREDIEA